MSHAGAAPATVIDRSRAACPINTPLGFTWEGDRGRKVILSVESPETGLCGVDWCCGGQHHQAQAAARFAALAYALLKYFF